MVCQFIHAQAEIAECFFKQLAGMSGGSLETTWVPLLVMFRDLDVIGVFLLPGEADPLYAVLPIPGL